MRIKPIHLIVFACIIITLLYITNSIKKEGFAVQTKSSIVNKDKTSSLGPGGVPPILSPSSSPTNNTSVPIPQNSTAGQIITAQSGGLPGMTTDNSTSVQCPDGTTSQNGLCP